MMGGVFGEGVHIIVLVLGITINPLGTKVWRPKLCQVRRPDRPSREIALHYDY